MPLELERVAATLRHQPRHSMPGVVTYLTSRGGTHEAWGVDPDDVRFDSGMQFVAGRAPHPGAGEVAVTEALARRLSLEVGDPFTLGYLHPELGTRSRAEFTVSGIFAMAEVFGELILGEVEEVAELACMPRHNALWLWHNPRRTVEDLVRELRGSLPRIRAPAYPYSYSSSGESPENNRYLAAYGGLPSPFANRVGPTFWYRGSVRDQLAHLGRTGAASVSGLVGLMFLVVGIAVTLTVLVIILDRQVTIGIYSVLGMSPEDIGNMFRTQLVGDSLCGTLLGSVALAVILSLAPSEGPAPTVSTVTCVLWIIAQVALVLWGGRVAWMLSGSRDLRSHLRGDADFDWWTLVNIWPQPVGTGEESA
ncbi:MAG: ABC transporter permease [Bacillota bacterium]